MRRARHLTILGLITVMAASGAACGDDDNDGTTGASGGAVAPPVGRTFGGLAQALEAQDLVVTRLPRASLNGAEVGVDITGTRRGEARSFTTEAEAEDYADQATQSGNKTTTVGSVVFEASAQDDADFFADAYEG